MIALAMVLLAALTPVQARQEARGAAEEFAGVRGAVSVGHCVVRGRFARCPVRVRSSRQHCRLVVHMRETRYGMALWSGDVECWVRGKA